ncbi:MULTISPECIES: YdcH family protein [Pseudomonas]|jgi:uncharacterized protein YdcH (DUF465 family)|uniref:DUF465 domain-containing protein n=1 Tax=Pseudomonas proteolytica TaxID=219574 RepID=A0AAW5AJJ5_9PSED|nr:MULTISPECIES: DUF465 domain-containing protein [Pseudomonas]TDR46157.1 hypothetical protein EDF80_105191 [Pseudomonas brenneri]KAA8696341.1 DUF465 domain-containing protein [Pseudomonas proteolytica]MCF5060955.1 DUF465 domain-containing protein [Pseudomonas proteolytica]MCF5104167.1 DUF465 domain-containing protein [Pseudomonas proteolytica]NMY96265.1 DUF465 domain-containing protein [Pseudomonas proteolytica]
MPVKHDLYQDLGLSKDVVDKRRAENPHLNALLDKYKTVDELVLSAEKAAGNDDELKKLKERRLLIKDEISQLL